MTFNWWGFPGVNALAKIILTKRTAVNLTMALAGSSFKKLLCNNKESLAKATAAIILLLISVKQQCEKSAVLEGLFSAVQIA